MVKVYFEGQRASEPVAIFKDEETYDASYQGLNGIAIKHGWSLITESIIDNVEIDDVFNWTENQAVKEEEVELLPSSILSKQMEDDNRKSLGDLNVLDTRKEVFFFNEHTGVAVFNNTVFVKTKEGGYLQNAYRFVYYNDLTLVFCGGNIIDHAWQKSMEEAKKYVGNRLTKYANQLQ
jgi:hypothetical protein